MTPDIRALASAALLAILPIDTVLAPRAADAVRVVVGESDDEGDAAPPDRGPDASEHARPGYEPTPEEVEAARRYLEARRERLKAEGADPDNQE